MADPVNPTPPTQTVPDPAIVAGLQDQSRALSDAKTKWDGLSDAQKDYLRQQDQVNQAQTKLNANTNLSSAATKLYNDAVNALTGGLKNLDVSMKSLQTNSSNITTFFDDASAKAVKFFSLLNNNKAFDGFVGSSGSATNTVREQFDDLSKASGGFTNAIKKLASESGGNPFFTKLIDMGEATALSFLDSASSAEKLEQSYLNMLGATGQLNTVFSKTGEIQDSLKNKTAQYSQAIATAAGNTHQSTARMAELSVALGAIPGGLDGISKTTGMDKLSSAATLAAGAMRNTSDVVKSVRLAYEDLSAANGKVTDATERGERMFSLMASTSQTLGLRFEDTEGFISKVASEFKNIGDNTEGATRILTRFQGALQATGLTASASTTIVSNMVTAVGKLSTGTAALVSQRSGGPGGLQGAFQIENLIREGKIDQVAQMTERAIRQQFGGRIVTQAEAGTSQQAAARFQQQRSLIQSGAFGKLASNDQDASRLLEALSKGTSATAEFITGQQAVEDTAKQGISIQREQTTILQTISNSLRQMQMAGERGIDSNVKNAIGTADRNSEVAQLIDGTGALNRQRGIENQKNPRSAADIDRIQIRESVSDNFFAVKAAGTQMVNLLKDVMNTLSGAIENTSADVETAVNQAKTRANGGNIRRSPPPTTLNGTIPAAVKSAQDNQPIKVDSTSNVNLTISVPDGLNVEAQPTEGVKVSINQQNNNFALNNYSIG